MPRAHLMRWSELLTALDLSPREGEADPEITDVCHDSRLAAPGCVFVSVPGTAHDGDDFVADALARGAVAVIGEGDYGASGAPWARVDDARVALGPIARSFWCPGFQPAAVVGVTGTNGKSTVAMLTHALLAARYGSNAAWLFGTITYRLGDEARPAPLTTPPAAEVFRHVGAATVAPDALALEVSSHALALDRVAGLLFDVAVWTNLTQDHLDFHGTMEEYYRAKRKLFSHYLKPGGRAVVNLDDPWGRRLVADGVCSRPVTYGSSPDCDVRSVGWTTSWQGSSLRVCCGDQEASLTSGLVGHFNRENLSALCAVAHALGLGPVDVQAALDAVPAIPGRMERIQLGATFAAVVDYAHTPDALDNALAAVRDLTEGKIICVFGCGGDRDRSKRVPMAQAVASGADMAVVTSDNPRGERPEAIAAETARGFPDAFPHWIRTDRRVAIGMALGAARSGDCVVVAGKGHETVQVVGGMRHPFDDRVVLREEYARLAAAGEAAPERPDRTADGG